MCGRYTYSKRRERLESRYEDAGPMLPFTPRYNIAPTQPAPVVMLEGGRIVEKEMTWGFLPKWSQGPIINAQQETIASKPTFKEAFARQRCLIPADGFYEWKKEPEQKIPMRFVLRDGATFYFAGLWDRFVKPVRRGAEEDLFGKSANEPPEVDTFLILTTPANAAVLSVHNRMPLIVRPDYYDVWLDPAASLDAVADAVKHPRNDELTAYRVRNVVNNVRNETAECIALA